MNGYLVTIGKVITLGLRPPQIPDDDSDPKAIKKYRREKHEWCYAMAIAVIGCFLLFALIAMPLVGWLPDHWNQVAWSADLAALDRKRDEKLQQVTGRIDQLEGKVDDIATEQRMARATQLSNAIFNARKEQCELIREKLNARIWTEQLKRLEGEYAALMKERFETPSCPEIGVPLS